MTLPGFLIPFRMIDLRIKDFGAALLPQALLTAAMALLCWGWLRGLTTFGIWNVWFRLLSTSALGIVAYLAGVRLFRPAAVGYVSEILGNSQNRVLARALSLIDKNSAQRLH